MHAVHVVIRRGAGWLGIDRNPLRRGTDRLESAARASLVLAALVCGPMLAGSVGGLTHASSLRQVAADRSWRQVDAYLLDSAPRQYLGYGPALTHWVSARWQAPSGAARSGFIPVPSGARRGTMVLVWVDSTGRATGHPPLTADLVGYRVAFAEIGTIAAMAAAVALLLSLLRWWLNRRRMARWALEWAYIGPRWTTRR